MTEIGRGKVTSVSNAGIRPMNLLQIYSSITTNEIRPLSLVL